MKEALSRFRRARELAPKDPSVAIYLGLSTESVGTPADALVLYQDAIRLERAPRVNSRNTKIHAGSML